MRYIVAIFVLSMIAGCPAVTRLYVHNKSVDTLIYYSYSDHVKPTKIGPGRTKWVPVNSDQVSCVELEINDEVRAYGVSLDVRMTGKSTGYGSRIDTYFEYDRMFVQQDSGDWIEIESSESCDATY